MPRFLSSPERLFALSMWLLSFVFAGFLMGLGSKVIADLPRVESGITLDQFIDHPQLDALQTTVATTESAEPGLRDRIRAATLDVQKAATASQAALRSHQEWLRTRAVTAHKGDDARDDTRDAALIAETARLQQLSDQQLVAEQALNAAEDALRANRQTQGEAERRIDALRSAAQPLYERAVHRQELRVFLLRLAITLPLVLIAGWLIARKRRSPRWPLARGFVLFALYAFFFELVPYLPSYGGYVRSVVGIALTLAAGHWGIRWMQAYLARRKAQEARNESERRLRLDNQQALARMRSDLCPGCERQILTTGDAAPDFCVHCGLRLFDRCVQCTARKNAFFNHCMSCGTAASIPHAPAGALPSGGARSDR